MFTHAVYAIQELSVFVKKQQDQVDARKQQIDRLLNIILNAQLVNHLNQFSGNRRKTN